MVVGRATYHLHLEWAGNISFPRAIPWSDMLGQGAKRSQWDHSRAWGIGQEWGRLPILS